VNLVHPSERSNSYNKDTLKKKLARIDENILKYLSQMDDNDKTQPEDASYTSEDIKAAIDELTKRKKTYIDFLK
jgi:hypothetical protein